jgi:hypothetical protein
MLILGGAEYLGCWEDFGRQPKKSGLAEFRHLFSAISAQANLPDAPKRATQMCPMRKGNWGKL